MKLFSTNELNLDGLFPEELPEVIFTEEEYEEGIESNVVNLYPQLKYEEFEGFGGALTDAAGYVYSQMNDEQKALVMNTYFSKEHMKYNIVRIHMDSCDFSTEMYEAMSDSEDKELKSFSFERTEKYIIPMLKDAEKAAGQSLEIMLSPWSPPVFMKTNGDRKHGGALKKEYRQMWAEYICRYIEEFQKRGFSVKRISLQNEPKAVQTWDSCIYTAKEEQEFLRDYMYPTLKAHGLDIEIFIWDHNKERAYERVVQIADDTVKGMVSGVACHWYSGDHFDGLSLIRAQFPELKIVISESCIEYSKFDADDQTVNASRLSHEIMGDLGHGVTAFYDWNIILDEDGGPNHVGNFCQAPFLYDTKNHVLMPQVLQRFFYQFSHFIERGARRIANSKFTELLDVISFENPNGEIVSVLQNRGTEDMPVVFRLNGKFAEVKLQPKEICTYVIQKEEYIQA